MAQRRSRRRRSQRVMDRSNAPTFYINRAGRTLSQTRRKRLEQAKDAQRALYGRPRHS